MVPFFFPFQEYFGNFSFKSIHVSSTFHITAHKTQYFRVSISDQPFYQRITFFIGNVEMIFAFHIYHAISKMYDKECSTCCLENRLLSLWYTPEMSWWNIMLTELEWRRKWALFFNSSQIQLWQQSKQLQSNGILCKWIYKMPFLGIIFLL